MSDTYKVVFKFGEDGIPDFRFVTADSVRVAVVKFYNYWDNRRGFKIIRIEKYGEILPEREWKKFVKR